MAEISGVITLGIGPTTVTPLTHFVLLGLNTTPVVPTGTALGVFAFLPMVGQIAAPLDVAGSVREDLEVMAGAHGVVEMR